MEKNKERLPEWLDAMIDETLKEESENPLPEGFSDRVMARIKKRNYRQEVLVESSLKALLVAGLIIVLLVTLLTAGLLSFQQITDFVSQHARIIVPIGSMILFTWFFDDVVLKLISGKNTRNYV